MEGVASPGRPQPVVKTKSAVAQSPGVAVTTRNSLALPCTAHTLREGSVERHDAEGSLVVNPVS